MKVKKLQQTLYLEVAAETGSKIFVTFHDQYGGKIWNVRPVPGHNLVLLEGKSACMKNKSAQPMTAEMLINALKDQDPNASIKIIDNDKREFLIFFVALSKDAVWLQCENDCNMEEEILGRFDLAVELGMDDIEVYSQMLEDGITVEIMRKYIGNEAANYMKVFCEEHELM